MCGDGGADSFFYFAKAVIPHMRPGSSIINNASINPFVRRPLPVLAASVHTRVAADWKVRLARLRMYVACMLRVQFHKGLI